MSALYTRPQIVNGSGWAPGALFAALTGDKVFVARELLAALDEAAQGDSNDAEIAAGREVADMLASIVGYRPAET